VVEPLIPEPTTSTSVSSTFSGPANRSWKISPRICPKEAEEEEEEEVEEEEGAEAWREGRVCVRWEAVLTVVVGRVFLLRAGEGRWKAWVERRRKERRAAGRPRTRERRRAGISG